MTNDKIPIEARMRNLRWLWTAVLLVGCAASTSPQSRKQLSTGFQALDQKDYNGAMAAAQQFLHEHPRGGPGTAEALYLEGRCYEQRATVEHDQGREAQSKVDWQAAREIYVHALS